MTEPSLPDLSGTVVAGKYRVEQLLGQGGMGSVWAGRHVTLGQLVAIKFVHPKLAGSAEARRRFDNEAKAAARIKSRHAVAVHDHGVTEAGQPYIVMEYLDGESLERAIRERGKLPFAEVVQIVAQSARALSAAHEAHVVHRDLKPDNVFLAKDNDGSRHGYGVKLVDFGIAKVVQDEAETGASSTQAGMVLGTPHYMSPEALTASAPVSAASDIWSLGACAFAAACGRVPFEGDAIGDVVLKVCAAPVPVPSKVDPSLPRAFDAWFAKCCSRDVSARFKSAAEAADALLRLEEWSRAERENVTYQFRPLQPSLALMDLELEPAPSTRGRMLAGILVGASLMLGLLGFYVMKRTREADELVRSSLARATASVEAESARRSKAAEEALLLSQKAAAAASASAQARALASQTRPARKPKAPLARPQSP
ncbi:MAG: serine/threonine protein kinase [Polyangiaceae bacterium]|jgi:serine/threonine-protein kinase|nr:serine/threonine protein kinase [Polyangiaceae bacterium]